MSLGSNLKERRLALHMTQTEVGRAVGVGKSTIARYENGIIRGAKPGMISALAKVLRCDVAWLMDVTDGFSSKDLPNRKIVIDLVGAANDLADEDVDMLVSLAYRLKEG